MFFKFYRLRSFMYFRTQFTRIIEFNLVIYKIAYLRLNSVQLAIHVVGLLRFLIFKRLESRASFGNGAMNMYANSVLNIGEKNIEKIQLATYTLLPSHIYLKNVYVELWKQLYINSKNNHVNSCEFYANQLLVTFFFNICNERASQIHVLHLS